MGPLHKTFNLAKACAVIECGEDRQSPRGTFTLQEAIRDSATKLLWGFMLHIWSTLACRVHHLCPALASFLITRLQPALAALIPSWPVLFSGRKLLRTWCLSRVPGSCVCRIISVTFFRRLTSSQSQHPTNAYEVIIMCRPLQAAGPRPLEAASL